MYVSLVQYHLTQDSCLSPKRGSTSGPAISHSEKKCVRIGLQLTIISGFHLLFSRLLARCTLIQQLSLLTVSIMHRGCGRYLVLSYGSTGCLRLCVHFNAVWRWGSSPGASRCMVVGFRSRVTHYQLQSGDSLRFERFECVLR